MYKGASQNAQHARDRISAADVAALEPEIQTVVQQHDSLKRALAQVERDILTLPRGSNERKVLGLRKLEIQQKIAATRPPKKPNYDLAYYFFTVVEQRYGRAVYKILIEDARKLMEAGEPDPTGRSSL